MIRCGQNNVTVTVALPPSMNNVTVFDVTEDGLVPPDCRVEGGKCVLEVDSIESGRVFPLRKV